MKKRIVKINGLYIPQIKRWYNFSWKNVTAGLWDNTPKSRMICSHKNKEEAIWALNNYCNKIEEEIKL